MDSMSRFQDKVVVITGGNGGIGMEVSRAFSKEGAKVSIFAKAILFLASSDASFITGTELAVDGGTTQL